MRSLRKIRVKLYRRTPPRRCSFCGFFLWPLAFSVFFRWGFSAEGGVVAIHVSLSLEVVLVLVLFLLECSTFLF